MQTVIEFLAVISGAMFGVLLARRKQMDFVGVLSVALLTAFGGGTLRDVLLDRHPLFWIRHHHYPVVVFWVAAVASLFPRIPRRLQKWLDIPDAFGMAMFSAVGTDIALQNGTSSFVAVLFGVMTGTFGGVMGDIVCNEVPSLFRPSTPLYGTCAFAGGWTMVLCQFLQLPDDMALWISSAVAVGMRFFALRYDICLKAISNHSD
jgi:uncharacterized membrane protein YeiH